MNALIHDRASAVQWRGKGGLSTACPILLGVLFLLNLNLPIGLGVWALYSVAIVAAIPTWDRRFVQELAATAAVLVLLHTVLQHDLTATPAMLLLNGVIGLLIVWVVLRLSQEVIQVHEQQVQRRKANDSEPDTGLHPAKLLTMCAWSKRVKDGDQWIPIEEFLRRRMNIPVTHGISDESKERVLKSLGLI